MLSSQIIFINLYFTLQNKIAELETGFEQKIAEWHKREQDKDVGQKYLHALIFSSISLKSF